MNWETFATFGSTEMISSGEFDPSQDGILDIDPPTHGTIAIEISPGRWLSIRTSEWLTLEMAPEPKPWSR